ncbi:LAMI_0C09362g1_1 [Lachancea mirantina]|uniref:LAMI_0C09362g1_1 n=1 Tax=Lachancea mirantina TaxID=1230905 RepID=A0A1G4J5C3_9SACH|nr:LAMI_0C09362g1_1 [Lachancea mirantina]
MTRKSDKKRDVFGRNLSYLLSCVPDLEQLDDIDLFSFDMESGYTPLHVCLKLGHFEKAFLLHKTWKLKDYTHKQGKPNVWDQKDREGLTPLELYRCCNDIWTSTAIPVAIYPGLRGSDQEALSMLKWQKRFDSHSDGGNCEKAEPGLPAVSELSNMYHLHRGAREMFTYGSNVNMQLGTGDVDDRQNLFKVDEYRLCGKANLTRARFKNAIMTRYHSVFMNMDGQVFTAGSNTRGRLGNGKSDVSNFQHQVVPLELDYVKLVASSDHHTLALTRSNDVLGWGWNKFGQLGYSTSGAASLNPDNSVDNTCSFNPRKIGNCPWKKTWGGSIKHLACSKVHSCLIDDRDTLFVWGLNLGQMGVAANVSPRTELSHAGKTGEPLSSPVGVKLPSYVKNIRQLACTDFTTFILFGENQLCVLNSYKVLRFTIPKAESKQQQQTSINQFDVFTPVSMSRKNSVIKLKSSHISGNNLCVLYENGVVGIIQVSSLEDSSHGWSRLSNILPVSLYWLPHFGWNKCLDFDVGSKGQLILCTTGGSVFTSTNEPGTVFRQQKFSRLAPGRCVSVSCDSLFSSFAILKDDLDSIPIGFPPNNILQKMEAISPLQFTPLRRIEGEQSSDLEERSYLFESFSMFRDQHELSHEMTIDSDLHVTKPIRPHDLLWTKVELRWSKSSSLEFSQMYRTANPLLVNSTGALFGGTDKFEVTFVSQKTGETLIGCHLNVLEARCPSFSQLIMKDGIVDEKSQSGICVTLIGKCGLDGGFFMKLAVTSEKFALQGLAFAIDYLYTDQIPNFDKISDQSERRRLERSTMAFIKFLGLYLTSSEKSSLPYAFKSLLDRSMASENDGHTDKVSVKLDNNDNFQCFPTVLGGSSDYFGALLSKTWSGENKLKRDVNLKHVSMNEFLCILKYMHGYTFHELFSHSSFEDHLDFVQYLLGVCEISDQLLIPGLKYYAESVIADFIDAENVIAIMVNAQNLKCKALVLVCAWYLLHNINILFSEKNFELVNKFVKKDIWGILEGLYREKVSRNLVRKFDTWYGDQNVSSRSFTDLFIKNTEKFNNIVMENTTFKAIFDICDQSNKPATSKRPSDRRKSSSSLPKKASLLQEDLTNIRRPSSSKESRGPNVFSYKNITKTEENESAIEDESFENQGFTVVRKSKVVGLVAQTKLEDVRAGMVESAEATSSTNSVKIEKSKSFSKGSSGGHRELFPTLSNAMKTGNNLEDLTKDLRKIPDSARQTLKALPGSSSKKISQKERMRIISKENDSAEKKSEEKKTAWGRQSGRKLSLPAAVAAPPPVKTNRFPSISESRLNSAGKRKASTDGLRSTGETTAIPLYLNNTGRSEGHTRSLKEAREEEIFTKWWNEESAKVQQELKRQQAFENSMMSSFQSQDKSAGELHGNENYPKGSRNKPRRTKVHIKSSV